MATFKFAELPVLRDGELELVAPHESLIDEVLRARGHPLSVACGQFSPLDRDSVLKFVRSCPGGHENPDAARGTAAAYHFWMRLTVPIGGIRMAGGVALRIGHDRNIELYAGHIGYHVYPPARGRHLAERAVRLLRPLALHHGINPVWITANPDNWPSRRTCERLGAVLVDTVVVPADHPFYARGEKLKCRYRWDLL